SSRARCSPSRADFLSASALARAFSLVERLDHFLVRFPLVRRSEEIFVFACRLLAIQLFRRGADFVGVGHRLSLFCVRLRLYSAISTVKARMVSVHVLCERIVDVGVVDHGLIHARHSGGVLEVVSTPSSAPVPISGIAVSVIDASIEPDGWPPVTLIKRIRTASPAPPSRCPKKPDSGRRDPHARYPVIVVVIGVPAPITWSPNITCARTGRLLIYRQRR